MKRILILTVVAALALGACASDEGTSDDETTASIPVSDLPSSASEDTPIPVEPNEGIGDGAQPLDEPVVSPNLAGVVDLAVADLAARLGNDVLIEVVVAHELTWPDGSLGCPQPDMMYTQALVGGYRIQLSDGDVDYDYHGATGQPPFLCEDVIEEKEPVEEAPVDDPVEDAAPAEPKEPIVRGNLEQLASAAVADLASRQGADPQDIRIVVAESVTWRDGSLGCPQEGMSYTQALTQGSRFKLELAGSTFWYHQGADRAPFLCLDPRDPLPGHGDA